MAAAQDQIHSNQKCPHALTCLQLDAAANSFVWHTTDKGRLSLEGDLRFREPTAAMNWCVSNKVIHEAVDVHPSGMFS